MVISLDELGDAGVTMPDGADSVAGFDGYHKIAEAEHLASFLRSGILDSGERLPRTICYDSIDYLTILPIRTKGRTLS
jgi:hypothetical protein